MSATAATASPMKKQSTLIAVGSFAAGVGTAKLLGMGIDKMIPYAPEAGKFEFKNVVKPVAFLALGGLGLYFSRNKATWGNENVRAAVRGASWGMITAGVVSGAQRVLNVSLFDGLGNPDGAGGSAPTEYYRAMGEQLNQLIQQNQFTPELPNPNGGASPEVKVEPAFNGVGSDLNIEYATEVL